MSEENQTPKQEILTLKNDFASVPEWALLGFSGELGEQAIDRIIKGVVIRASEFKARWMGAMMDGAGYNILRKDPEWDEESEGLMPPTISSAMKAVSSCEGLPEQTDSSEGWVVNLATDVVLADQDGKQILKPREATTLADIESLLLGSLTGRPRTFTVQASPSIYAVNGHDPDHHIGICQLEQHTFKIEPLEPAEIELYMYGLKGRDGSSPEYLKSIYQKLVDTYKLDQEDLSQLERGLTLEELKQSNLGCRWPYINLQSHIIEANGVDRGDEQFNQELQKLFWSLLGAPVSARELIVHFAHSRNVDSMDANSSLFPELPGAWVQLISRNGKTYSISRITEGDCEGLSKMAANNFNNAPTYAYLDDQSRLCYINANNPDGVWQTATHYNNVAALVVEEITDGKDVPVGWTIIRKMGDGGYADCRRIHMDMGVQGQGIGRQLMRVAEELAKHSGCRAMVVNASGTSFEFFGRLGYSLLGSTETKTGIFSADDQPKPTMVKMIKVI